MNNNLVVYTALFGKYDDLVEPPEKFENCDFVCFTDQIGLTSDIWDIRLLPNSHLNGTMNNRLFKILPHKFLAEYTFSLYIDTNIYLKKNPFALIEKYLNNDCHFAVPKHQQRDCVFQEAKECIVLNRAGFKETVNQMKDYRKSGMPSSFGLTENGILLRNHSDLALQKILNEWWDELNLFTQRDQLCLPYVLWRNTQTPRYMEESIRISNNFFEIGTHKVVANKTIFDKVIFKFDVMLKRFLLSFIRF